MRGTHSTATSRRPTGCTGCSNACRAGDPTPRFRKRAARPMREVWITGIGVVSALGSGFDAHADAVREMRSGLAGHALFDGQEPDPCMCGIVPPEILSASIEESAHDRCELLLDQAIGQALGHAGLYRGCNADVIAGTTLGNMHGGTRYYRGIHGGEEASPDLIRHFIPSTAIESVIRRHEIRGMHQTVCSACASASGALGRAFRRIRSGRCTRAMAGGVDALSPFVVAGFNSLRLVSSSRSRPFDRDRDGLNPGEGAAMLVLESAKEARERGARPLAKIAGFGEALEAYHYTRADPAGTGVTGALRDALSSSGMQASAIDHVHMHGTGTRANDRSEFVACRSVFGEHLKDIPACSTKPMTGHTFGAAGAINAVFVVTSLARGLVPATLYCENQDPEFAALRLLRVPERVPGLATVASCALGFGGEASVLIFSKADL
ncbi:MAG: hypothetical protein GF418_01420 [Chitinivibrionales bacterium]|nr:hypothetical protein [Chitinivibrionales bacterium]MBD3394262.1 hypothetical protein [Chitinivibrionales bacterium]